MSIGSGGQYPCSIGVNVDVYCYYESGSSTGFGRPTRIYITSFATPNPSTLSLRLLFSNPDVIGAIPTFTFKAFGGSITGANLMGSQLKGRFSILDVNSFMVIPTTAGASATSSCIAYPNKNLYQKSTAYNFYIGTAMNANTYSVLQYRLGDPTYG